ncbi:hypothetical protein WT15_23915 [Burkholderia stagnalis]|uniref:hypothetical protein n=1 Tax=Burkholderia stagnalis TaxID=1503054 RepID=UPI000758BBF9|nr:hypothetical protein [Burkholderia stagnalis]KVN73890.1 hypothetical protein WT15_23915 [Burkholderia stagnalis]KWO27064.1 hypothetical protein WT96_31310 [Burkholderia stagnalis]KWO45061.1 hypothetical protein WT95_26950 [Burkholderia stagnalis]
MANQPEQDQWDAGVYQIEKTDPVLGGLGGIANAPLLNLANRTKYLYSRIQEILGVSKGYAIAGGTANAITCSYTPAVSAIADGQTFKGKVAGANTGATTFTPNPAAQGGIAPLPVYGLDLQPLSGGEIVGQFAVQYNASLNSGGGAFVLVENPGGIVRAVAPALTDNSAASAPTSWIRTLFAPLASPAFTGSPQAPVAAQFDNTTRLATMSALMRDRFGFSGFAYFNANANLPASALGSVIDCALGSGSYTLTLPALTPAMSGSAIKFVSYSKNPVFVASGSATKIWLGFSGAGSGSSFPLQNGDTATLITDGFAWYVIDGSVLLPYAARSAFMVFASYAQSIASAVSTKVMLDSKEFDVLGEFDVTTSRFRPSTPGKYLLSGTVDIAAGVVGAGALGFLYKNGGQYKAGATTRFAATTHTGASVTAVVDMNGSTDYVELFAYQDTNATQYIAAGMLATYFSGIRVG